jgi:TatD DNase family protein
MWFETHAHLSDPQFDPDRREVIQRAIQSGVTRFVEIADGPSEWPKARALSEMHPEHIWWAGGLHPYYSQEASPALWGDLRNHASHPRFVGIGEVGLDYAKCEIPPDVQKTAFKAAIELSLEIDKPLIIHCREAYPDLLDLLTPYKKEFLEKSPHPPGVNHCFSGGPQDASVLLGLGFYIGIDGPVTYSSAKILRQALEVIPLNRLVIETDSPYLPPQSHRGKRNEPAYIPEIGLKMADLKGVTPEMLAKTLTDNGRRLFRLPS